MVGHPRSSRTSASETKIMGKASESVSSHPASKVTKGITAEAKPNMTQNPVSRSVIMGEAAIEGP